VSLPSNANVFGKTVTKWWTNSTSSNLCAILATSSNFQNIRQNHLLNKLTTLLSLSIDHSCWLWKLLRLRNQRLTEDRMQVKCLQCAVCRCGQVWSWDKASHRCKEVSFNHCRKKLKWSNRRVNARLQEVYRVKLDRQSNHLSSRMFGNNHWVIKSRSSFSTSSESWHTWSTWYVTKFRSVLKMGTAAVSTPSVNGHGPWWTSWISAVRW